MIIIIYGIFAVFFISIGLLYARLLRPTGYLSTISLFCFAATVFFFLAAMLLKSEDVYMYLQNGYSDSAWIINAISCFVFTLTAVITCHFLHGPSLYKRYAPKLLLWRSWKLEKINIRFISCCAIIPVIVAVIFLWKMWGVYSYAEFLINRTKIMSGYGYILSIWHWLGVFLLIYFVYIFVKYNGKSFLIRLFFIVFPLSLCNSLMWFSTGSRSRGLILYLYFLAIYVILKSRDSGQFRRILILTILILSTIYLGLMMGPVREAMVGGREVLLTELDTSASGERFLTEGNMFMVTENNLWVIDNVGLDRMLAGSTFLAIIAGVVPRGIWQGKPVGSGPALRNLMNPGSYDIVEGENLTSASPGILTEFLMNFHWPGALVGGVIFGILLVILSYILRYVNDPCAFVIWFLCAICIFGMLTGEVLASIALLVSRMLFFVFLHVMKILTGKTRKILY